MAQTTETHWAMEKILAKRIRSNKVQYLVKWFGLSADFNSWVHEEKCRVEIIREFHLATTEEFPVEKILDKRIRAGKVSFF